MIQCVCSKLINEVHLDFSMLLRHFDVGYIWVSALHIRKGAEASRCYKVTNANGLSVSSGDKYKKGRAEKGGTCFPKIMRLYVFLLIILGCFSQIHVCSSRCFGVPSNIT